MTKLLLADLAAGAGEDPLESYRRYLQATVNVRVSHATVSGLGGRQLARFYRLDDPTASPMFLDYADHRHLASLDALFGRRLVLVRSPARSGDWERLFDNRIMDLAHGDDEEGPRPASADPVAVGGGDDHGYCLPVVADYTRGKPVALYALDCHRKGRPPGMGQTVWLLYRHRSRHPGLLLKELDASCESFLVSHSYRPPPPLEQVCRWGDGRCLAEKIRSLLSEFCPLPPDAGPPPPPHAEHDGSCASLEGFLESAARAHAAVGRPFVLAAHLGTRPRKNRTTDPQHQFFSVLVVAHDGDSSGAERRPRPAMMSMPVVMVSVGGSVYLPVDAYADVVRFPRICDRRVFPRHESLPGLEHPGRRRTAPAAPPARAVPSGFPDEDCCNPCKNAGAYRDNMGDGGRQRLFRMQLSTYDCLHLLGLDTEEHRRSVREACRLSSCSYDAESCTSQTKSEAAQPDLHYDFQPLGDAPLPRRVVGIQTPVLLGVTDALDLDDGLDPEILTCEAGGHEELVVAFADSILRRRDRAVTAKYGVLSDLMAASDAFRTAFFAFHDAEDAAAAAAAVPASAAAPDPVAEDDDSDDDDDADDDDDDPLFVTLPPTRGSSRRRQQDLSPEGEARRRASRLGSAWRNTLFGRLEQNLTALANRFVVWGFNCEGYDLPLMAATLCTTLQERGLGRVRMQREGTKVRWLSADQITFHEVRRLLPAGTSLEKFRAMCRLEDCSKMIFPFDLLDESLEFLRARSLPPDARDWASRLTGEAPAQSEVDDARALFDSLGMSSVSCYLQHYLKMDVLMLARGVDCLRETYFDLLGIDLVDVNRATVSSLAAMGAQRHLYLNRRVGMFSHDDRRVYSLLRQGLRGGLTAVYRTIAGADADYADSVWLHRRQAAWEGREETRSDGEIERELRGLNAHRLPPPPPRRQRHPPGGGGGGGGDDDGDFGPQPDSVLNYYDMVGLYSCAGERDRRPPSARREGEGIGVAAARRRSGARCAGARWGKGGGGRKGGGRGGGGRRGRLRRRRRRLPSRREDARGPPRRSPLPLLLLPLPLLLLPPPSSADDAAAGAEVGRRGAAPPRRLRLRRGGRRARRPTSPLRVAGGKSLTSLSLFAAARSLPYGTCVLYTGRGSRRGGGGGREEEKEELVLERDGATSRHPGTDCQESAFVQWLSSCALPESSRILSDWTAGPGQTCFGSDFRQRIDAVACVPPRRREAGGGGSGGGGKTRLAFVNYHGQRFHGDGDHLPGCPRRPRRRRRFPRRCCWGAGRAAS